MKDPNMTPTPHPRRSARLRRPAPLALACALLGGLAVQPALSYADALPDGRVYEQVTPIQKFGTDAPFVELNNGSNQLGQITAGAADGNAVDYGVNGGFADTRGSYNKTLFNSSRTATGWTTRAVTPPVLGNTPNGTTGPPTAYGFSDDLSKAFFESGTDKVVADAPVNPSGAGGTATFLSDLGDGSLTWLDAPQIPAPTPSTVVFGLGASSSLDHILVEPFCDGGTGSPRADCTTRVLPEDVGRTQGAELYDYTARRLTMVGVLPDGSVPEHGATAATVGPTYTGIGVAPVLPTSFGNQISRDGRHIVFVSPDPLTTGNAVPPQLYVRMDGTSTELVSRNTLAGDGPDMTGDPRFAYASPDGSKVWFMSNNRLTASAPAGTDTKLYEFDVVTRALSYLPDPGAPDRVSAIALPLASSADGSRFVYIKAGTQELWLDDNGARTQVAAPVTLSTLSEDVRMTADGSRLVFATGASIPGFNDAGGFLQAYVYDVASRGLSCASCPPAGQAPSSDITFTTLTADGSWTSNRGISADGRRVYFDTVSALVGGDVNGKRDVYQWEDGTVSLLSSGRGTDDSFIVDNSTSGDDVFVATRANLGPDDTDGSYDIYDARVGGGFPRPAAAASCASECQGGPSSPPLFAAPGSSTYSGPGNPLAPPELGPAAAPTKASFTIGTLSAKARSTLARTGKVTVSLKATAAGTASVALEAQLAGRWTQSAGAKKSLPRAGRASVPLTLSKAARAYLAKHRRMHVRVSVTSAGATKRTTLTLMAAKATEAHR
jgi:hypothetical protein